MTSIHQSSQNKVAIVYDWFDSWGGAERVLQTFHEMFPQADWYTSWADSRLRWYKDFGNINTSFIQKIPLIRSHRTLSIPLYPLAFEGFSFSNYETVISVTSSFAKGIITHPDTKHICYMLTPTRFLWSAKKDYVTKGTSQFMKQYLHYLKEWDIIAAQRPDKIITISKTVQDRVTEYYNRESDVIYPPLDHSYWEGVLRKADTPSDSLPNSYYLVVSRLRPYKKVDMAIRAFNSLENENLVVVGSGNKKYAEYLHSLARPNITFLQDLEDHELAFLYGHAKGLIMPQEEDFGYTALEAKLCTCPVIAYNKGGATETVIHEKTGYLFAQQSPQGIIEAVENFTPMAYTVQRHLQMASDQEMTRFSKESFIKKFRINL